MNIYPQGKKSLTDGTVVWPTADIRVALVTSAWVYNAAHQFVGDGVTSAIVARSGALANKGVNVSGANAELIADDITIGSVAAGSTVTGAILYSEGAGTDATRRLLAFIDKAQDGTTAISLATNGSGVLVDFLAAGLLEF